MKFISFYKFFKKKKMDSEKKLNFFHVEAVPPGQIFPFAVEKWIQNLQMCTISVINTLIKRNI